jgi:hypothetical protein
VNPDPRSVPQSRLANGVQGELIPLEELPDAFYAPEESGENAEKPRYTAGRFFSKRPQDYELCVAMLAAGLGRLKIARLLKVHHETVRAVALSEGEQIDIQKQRLKRNLRDAIDIAAERLPDIMASLPAGQVPVAAAVLIDKLAQLEGEPTQRVEVTIKGHLTEAAVRAQLSAFPEAIDIEASPMVSGAEIEAQKGLPATGADASNRAQDNEAPEASS